jgi:hypothetical protein
MKRAIDLICAGLLCVFATFVASAQQPAKTTATVPRLVKFSGTFIDGGGKPLSGVVGVTFALYDEERGGAPLWMETQNVQGDSDGRYTAMLGATRNDGIPADVLASEQGRWLSVQPQGETEQPRVLLVSVPYALKASDADTLGGKPASAYLLAGSAASVQPAGPSVPQPGQPEGAASGRPAVGLKPALASTGTTNYISKFTDTSGDTGNSVMYQNGSNIGIGTTVAPISMDVRPTATSTYAQLGVAQTVDYMTLFASDTFGPAFYWDPAKALRFGKGGTALYSATGFVEYMRIQPNGNVGIGTMTPAATLEVNGGAQVDGNLTLGGVTGGTIWSSIFSIPILQAPNNLSSNFSAGWGALPSTTGINDTAVGYSALSLNTTGNGNMASGTFALGDNTTGNSNTAVGGYALGFNTTGSNNIAIGYEAGFDNLKTASNNIDIGNQGANGDSAAIRIGSAGAQTNTYIAGIYGVTSFGIPVYINSLGQLGTVPSSRRYKEDIQDMADASSGLLRLRPVTFRYKKPSDDGSKPVQYGLIAEEVAEVYPDLVARSADGQIETVKYQLLDPMLLNELQKQHATITAQQEQIRSLEERLAKVEAALSGPTVTSAAR